MTQSFDIVILGGGTAGYVAAIRAAQLGKTVAVVEKDKLGGTCLHRGCIPSKALLRSAEIYASLRDGDRFGIEVSGMRFDLNKAMERKQAVVNQLHRGIEYLMKKHSVAVFRGIGRLIGPSIFSPRSGSVSVEQEDGEIVTLVPGHLIIATGSRPRTLGQIEPDGERIITSDHALQMEELPASIVIVGGGVIGVEWASMLNDFGVHVTIVEYADRLIPTEDEEISRELERTLKRRGVNIWTGSAVQPDTLEISESGVSFKAVRGEEIASFTAEKLLLSVGRQANIEGFGLENTDVKVENGFIKVNESMQTAEAHIYAVGDCIGGLQLAHAASHEGIVAVEHICGLRDHWYAPHLVPRCIYTRTEVASVGLTEREAKDKGYDVKTGKVPFQAIGKALVHGSGEGFAKVVADRRSGDILGVHMIGAHVTELISEAALAQLLNAAPWEVGRTIHPHPSLSEIVGEAMLAVDGQAIGI